MNKTLLLQDLSRLLELDISLLHDDFRLIEAANWDSLSVVSTVAVIDQYYKIRIKGTELIGCNTIGDIFKIIQLKETCCAD